jgi:hypothetical protein
LLYGYASGSETITREIIEEVIENLDLSSSNLKKNHASEFGEISSRA